MIKDSKKVKTVAIDSARAELRVVIFLTDGQPTYYGTGPLGAAEIQAQML